MEFLAFTLTALTEHSARFLTHESATEWSVYLALADEQSKAMDVEAWF